MHRPASCGPGRAPRAACNIYGAVCARNAAHYLCALRAHRAVSEQALVALRSTPARCSARRRAAECVGRAGCACTASTDAMQCKSAQTGAFGLIRVRRCRHPLGCTWLGPDQATELVQTFRPKNPRALACTAVCLQRVQKTAENIHAPPARRPLVSPPR